MLAWARLVAVFDDEIFQQNSPSKHSLDQTCRMISVC